MLVAPSLEEEAPDNNLELERGMDNHILVAHSCLINSLIRKVKKRKEEREKGGSE